MTKIGRKTRNFAGNSFMAVRRHDDRHGCVSLPTLLTLRFYHYSIFNKRNIMQRILPPQSLNCA